MNRTEARTLVRSLNNDEIRVLIEAIRTRQQEIQRETANDFEVGEKVWFEGSHARHIEGVVKKVNQKTVLVSVGPIDWRVTSTLLHKVKNDLI